MRDKILNFGNGIIEIPTERETNCDNVITEIGKKKNLWQLWQCHCRKWKEKKNLVIAEITCEEFKKKSVTPTIFLQHFHNKSQVISYY